MTKQMVSAALYLAERRLLYEYPRRGYGPYDRRHLVNLHAGYLGEFALLEYISWLYSKHSQPSSSNSPLEYHLVLGKPHAKADFVVAGKLVEVKTYGTRLLPHAEHCSRYRLLVDCDQRSHPADIYVQCFLIGKSSPESVIIAGIHHGLPSRIDHSLPRPAYYCPVTELAPVSELERVVERYCLRVCSQ